MIKLIRRGFLWSRRRKERYGRVRRDVPTSNKFGQRPKTMIMTRVC